MKLSGAYTIAVATLAAGIYSATVDTGVSTTDEDSSADPPAPSLRTAVFSLDLPEVAFGAAVREEPGFAGPPVVADRSSANVPAPSMQPASLSVEQPEVAFGAALREEPRVDASLAAARSAPAEIPALPAQPAALAVELPDATLGAAVREEPHLAGSPAALDTLLAEAPVLSVHPAALAVQVPNVALGAAVREAPHFAGSPAAVDMLLAEAPALNVQPASLSVELPKVSIGPAVRQAPHVASSSASVDTLVAEAPGLSVQPAAPAVKLPEVAIAKAERKEPRFAGPRAAVDTLAAEASALSVQPAALATDVPAIRLSEAVHEAPRITAPLAAAAPAPAQVHIPSAQPAAFAVDLPEVEFGAATQDYLRLAAKSATVEPSHAVAPKPAAAPGPRATPDEPAVTASGGSDTTRARDDIDEIEALRQEVREVKAREAAAQRRVQELEKLASRLEAVADRLAVFEPIAPSESATLRGTYAAPARATPPDSTLAFFQEDQPSTVASNTAGGRTEAADADLNLPEEPEGEDRKTPAPTQAVEDVVSEQQGNFGSRVSFEVEAGYSHFGKSRINLNGFLALDSIFLGTISVDKVTSDIFTFSPTIRVGLTNRLALDANVPYLFRQTNYQSGGAGGSASGLVEKTVAENGIGDLSLGMSYRIIPETAGQPDVVFNARVKFPTGRDPYGIPLEVVPNSQENLQVPVNLSTGTGVYSFAYGLSVLKTLDPLVAFGSVNIFHNFRRTFNDINEQPGEQPGRVDVGDAVQFGAGIAFALNERSSISMSYSQRIVQHSRISAGKGLGWSSVVGSQGNVAQVNLGTTFSLGPNVSLRANVGIGLTDDSPDMAVGVSLPIRF